jgi:anti-anti-sigma factor
VNDLATVEVLELGTVVRARLIGEIDVSNASDVEVAIAELVPNDASGMELDLSSIRYIDSRGIRMLLTLVGRFEWRGKELRLVAPPGCRARRVIELCGAEATLTPSDAARGGDAPAPTA